MGKMAYSFSRIKTFRCPFRFKKLYIDKKTEPTGELAEIGGAIHGFAARYRQECIERSRDHIPGWFEKNVPAKFNSKTPAVDKGIREGLEKFKRGPMFRMPTAVEYRVEEKWAFDSGWNLLGDWFHESTFFRAIADFITIGEDGLVTIYDDKTGWAKGYDELQLKIYAWAVLRVLDKQESQIEGVSLKFNLIGQEKIEDKGFYSREEILYFRDEIMEKVGAIENNKDWSTANPESGACGYCGFHDDCPAMQKEFAVISADQKPVFKLTTKEDAERAVQCYVMVKARMKDLKADINQYVTDNGPVNAYGMLAERRIKKDWKAGNNDILGALLEADVPSYVIDQNISLPLTVVKEILKAARRYDMLEDVMAVGKMTEIQKPVGFYKGG